MKLKKAISVTLAVLLLLTVGSLTAFAATSGYDVDVQGAGTPNVTDTVESYLAQFGCTGLTGTMRVTVVQLAAGVRMDADSAAISAINREASDPNIDFYGEISASYVDGVRDEASVTYEEAVKENGEWKLVSGSTFTTDRQYAVACFVQATNGASSDDIFANFGNGAMFFKITNNCVPGSAYLVPTKLVQPRGAVSGNIFERFIKAIQMLFEEIRSFFAMIFGR